MKRFLSPPAVLLNLILASGLAALWVVFAPANLGGRLSYVIVNGNSMEPGFHLGDLTLMRKAPEYQVGDVVTYRDAKMQAFVIHRIIAVEQDHFVLKGDNNSWIDAYRPTREEIVGKFWVHVPKLGRVFKWLRAPLNLALAVALLGGLLMISMFKPSQPQKWKNSPSGNDGSILEAGLYLSGFFALVFLGLALFAFTRPLTRNADKIRYVQEGSFSYSASGTPVIYDTDTVRSGEPVFPRLTCSLDIAFSYAVRGDALQQVSGSYQLIGRVMDEQSGWQRTIPMGPATAFQGSSFSTASTLDLCQVVALVNVLKQETGLSASNYTLEVIPQVAMTATTPGNQVSDVFEPRLVFRFDEVHFALATPEGQKDPLHSSSEGSATNSSLEANTLSIPGWEPTILTVRLISLLGLAVAASGLAIAGTYLLGAARQSPEALIRLKYGGLLVNVYRKDLAPTPMLIDVTTIHELAKLAERNNTVILHMTLNFLHCYLVQCNGITYRYVFSSGRRNTAAVEVPRREITEYPLSARGSDFAGMEGDPGELLPCTIDQARADRRETAGTVILGKIRL